MMFPAADIIDRDIPMIMPKIRLLLDSTSPNFVAQVRALPEASDFDLLMYDEANLEESYQFLQHAEAAYIYHHPFPAEAIGSAPNLRFIQKHGLNCNNIDIGAATERGIPVATWPLLRSISVAEHAFALMIACARKIVPAHRAVVNSIYLELGIEPVRTSQGEYRANWAKIPDVVELTGASVGIIGLGDIGMEIARRCRAFGMKVFYHQRRRHTTDIEAALQAEFLTFEQLLRTVDYLILAIPFSSQTEHLIGTKELRQMKRSATLINVARGRVVDEDALTEALSTGKLAMAGLDVFRDEPLPAHSPLNQLSNVVLTPHIGGGSYRSRDLDHPACMRNILRFFKGEQPGGIINMGNGKPL
ncbi:2-hydroxyacid dehydrogenase [Pseudochelatococcus sp. B33]